MRFRTEIETGRGSFEIAHSDRIVMLGSCFTDNIGQRLERDGFDAVYNSLGPLYNPFSLARLIEDLLDGRRYKASDFVVDAEGVSHCLDFASKYQSGDAQALADELNSRMSLLAGQLRSASLLVVTFGSSVVYSLTSAADGTVGNCHKFPSSMFSRLTLTVEQIVERWKPLVARLKAMGVRLIFTVSPIRHLADGLHGNQLSKARLLLACDRLTADCADYFPSYEIMLDDLRDYRFYAADMKHPSEQACDYIYETFQQKYFSKATMSEALRCRERALRLSHRPIITT